ncbi:MAG: glycosyltransferase family 2 protein [Candidatus Aenigmatarchaeota archaeon]
MSEIPEISVLVPIYNEEKNIEKVVYSVISSLNRKKIEIILIDDGSTDKTLEIIEGITNKYDYIKCIKNETNLGYSDALKIGFKEAKGRFITFIDGDMQNDPSEILKLSKFLVNGYDMAIGWRKYRKDPFHRIIISKFWNSICHLLFFVNLPDINGKPKIFKREILENLEIETKHWVIDLELVHKSLKKGYKIIQVPVNHNERGDKRTKATIKKGLKSLISLLKYRLKSI